MINNLAREKFGTPPGTIHEPKNKSLPKSREKEIISEHDHINSTIKDDVSTLAEKPRSSEKIMNLNETNAMNIETIEPVKDFDEDMLDISPSKEIDMNTIISHQTNLTEKPRSTGDLNNYFKFHVC